MWILLIAPTIRMSHVFGGTPAGLVRAQEPVTGPADDDDPKSSPEVNEMANMHIIDNCSLVFFVYAPIALFSPKTILIDYLQCPSKASLLSLLVSWAL